MKLSLLIILHTVADIAIGACDIGWSEYKEDCIYFSHDKRRWNDAEADCRKRGGWLASDDSADKHDFIRTILNVLRNLFHSWIPFVTYKDVVGVGCEAGDAYSSGLLDLTSNMFGDWNYHHYFLGATDYYFEGQYRWIETGRSVGPFMKWSQGQPSTNATRNCLSLVWQNETDLVWQDDRCDDYIFYICEKLSNSTEPVIIG